MKRSMSVPREVPPKRPWRAAGTVRPRMEHLKKVSKDQEEADRREFSLAEYEKARQCVQDRMHALLVQLRQGGNREQAPRTRPQEREPTRMTSPEVQRIRSSLSKISHEMKVTSSPPEDCKVLRQALQAREEQLQKLQSEVERLQKAALPSIQRPGEVEVSILLDGEKKEDMGQIDEVWTLRQRVSQLEAELRKSQAAEEPLLQLQAEVQQLRAAEMTATRKLQQAEHSMQYVGQLEEEAQQLRAKTAELQEQLSRSHVPGLRDKVAELQAQLTRCQAAAEEHVQKLQEEVQHVRSNEQSALRQVQELSQSNDEAQGTMAYLRQLEEEAPRLRARVAELQVQVPTGIAAEEQVQKLEAEVVKLRKILSEQQAQLGRNWAQEEHLQKLHAEVERLQAAEAAANKRILELSKPKEVSVSLDSVDAEKLQQVKQWEKEVPLLRAKVCELQAQLTRSHACLQKAEHRVQELLAEVGGLKSAQMAGTQKIQELSMAKEEAERVLHVMWHLEQEVPKLRWQVSDLQAQLGKSRASEEQLQAEVGRLRDLEAQTAQKCHELMSVTQEAERTLQRLHHLDQEVPSLRWKVSDLQAQLTQSEVIKENMQGEVTAQRKMVSELQAQLAKFQGAAEKLELFETYDQEVLMLRRKVVELQAQLAQSLNQDSGVAQKLELLQQYDQEVPALRRKVVELQAQLKSRSAAEDQVLILQAQELRKPKEEVEVAIVLGGANAEQQAGCCLDSQHRSLEAERMRGLWRLREREVRRSMEPQLLPFLWSCWRDLLLEKKRAQRAGWEAEARWAKEEYCKEATMCAELRRQLAEERACRRRAEEVSERQLKRLKELQHNDLSLQSQLEQQEHCFRLELEQLRTEAESRTRLAMGSARSRARSTPREDVITSPQSARACFVEDASVAARSLVQEVLHFEAFPGNEMRKCKDRHRPPLPACRSRSNPALAREPEHRSSPSGREVADEGYQPATIVEIHLSDPGEAVPSLNAWLEQDEGQSERSVDAITVQDHASEGGADDGTAALLHGRLEAVLQSAMETGYVPPATMPPADVGGTTSGRHDRMM